MNRISEMKQTRQQQAYELEDAWIMEYAMELGLLKLGWKMRQRLNVSVKLVLLDPFEHPYYSDSRRVDLTHAQSQSNKTDENGTAPSPSNASEANNTTPSSNTTRLLASEASKPPSVAPVRSASAPIDPTGRVVRVSCFTPDNFNGLDMFLLEHVLSYDDLLLSLMRRVAEREHTRETREGRGGWGIGFLRNVITGEHYRFLNIWVTRGSFIAAFFIMLVFVCSPIILVHFLTFDILLTFYVFLL